MAAAASLMAPAHRRHPDDDETHLMQPALKEARAVLHIPVCLGAADGLSGEPAAAFQATADTAEHAKVAVCAMAKLSSKMKKMSQRMAKAHSLKAHAQDMPAYHREMRAIQAELSSAEIELQAE